ncbi:MAG: glycosyltransferase [Rhodospirillales bacterium]|nr:MAG: glycosyltransferase [Rhodospirillales bacterium]
MKIGFTTFATAFQQRGGLEVQIRATQAALRQLGVDVNIVDLPNDRLSNYNIIHHFSKSQEGFRVIEAASKLGCATVFSPLIPFVDTQIEALKIKLVCYTLHKTLGRDFMTRWDTYTEGIKKADLVCALTNRERSTITRLVPEAGPKVRVVPNGIGQEFFMASEIKFGEKYGMRGDFVLSASSIEPNKNILRTVRAAKAEGYRVVLVGSIGDEAYYNRCLVEGGDNVRYVGEMPYPSSLLTSAYAAAGAVVLASFSEAFGLVPFEALAAGTPSILTNASGVDTPTSLPWFQRVAPDDDQGLRRAIRIAMEAPRDRESCRALVQDMSWSSVSKKLLGLYEELMRREGGRI